MPPTLSLGDQNVWEAPNKLFSKVIFTKGYGFHTPQDGALCKIKVLLDEEHVIKGLDCHQIMEFIIGDVDEPVTKIIEACVRTMKEEEICCLKFNHPSFHCQINPRQSIGNKLINIKLHNDASIEKNIDASDSSHKESSSDYAEGSLVEKIDQDCAKQALENQVKSLLEESREGNKLQSAQAASSEDDTKLNEQVDENIECHLYEGEQTPTMFEVQLQLFSHSREPEIWEMSVTEKWRRATYHKQKGMELYARGEYQWAFHRFSMTLKYIISLEHDVPSGHEEGMNMIGLKLSCYLNVAACQMRHYNFESVIKNCNKALTIEPNNPKALYRRGTAFLQIQEFEKAKEDLSMAQELEPKNPAIAKQQQLLKSRVQKLNQYYASAMKKMFS